MNEAGLLPTGKLEQAFAALGDRLARRGVVADLYIVDGTVTAIAYDANLVTRDAAATFLPHDIVADEARNVANAMDLPPHWLADQAGTYVARQHNAGKREVFDHPGLRVMAAAPRHVFALATLADCDRNDLRMLAGVIGISTLDAALEICTRFLPGQELPSRSRAVLEKLFEPT